MTVLQQLYRHNRWANLTLVDFCTTVPPDALEAKAPGSVFVAYGCLVHLVQNEEGYLATIADHPEPPNWSPDFFPSLAEMRDRLATCGARYIEIAGEITEEELVRGEFEGEPFEMPRYIPFLQCINHSTEHREQTKACLTVAGEEPPPLDFWTWHESGQP